MASTAYTEPVRVFKSKRPDLCLSEPKVPKVKDLDPERKDDIREFVRDCGYPECSLD